MSQSTEDAILRKFGEMKRLIPILAAVVALAGPLAAGGAAMAKDHGDRGARGSERGGDRGPQRGGGDRGGRDRGGYAPGGYERRGGDDRARGYERPVYPSRGGPPPGYREDRGEPYRGDRRVYEYDAPPTQRYAPSARRGGYMPPQAAPPVQDPSRYRLRPPPRGFTWVRTANGYAMVGQDGRVFDVVPY
jgi:Ni/Co efflux regulator RcnB